MAYNARREVPLYLRIATIVLHHLCEWNVP
jgi:hypothetical protein